MRMMKSLMLWIALQFVCSETSRTHSFYHLIIHQKKHEKLNLYPVKALLIITSNLEDPENKCECWQQQIVVYPVSSWKITNFLSHKTQTETLACVICM